MAFSNPSFYDAPGMMVQQAVRGNLDVRNTLLNPDALSPSQRQSLYEGATAGGFKNKLLDTVGEIASNPFTYILLLTGPVGAKALKEGKSLLEVSQKNSVFFRNSLSFLEALGVMDPMYMAGNGTKLPNHVASAAGHIEETRRVSQLISIEAQKPLLDYFSKRFKRPITSLDLADFADPLERQIVGEVMTGIGAKLEGLDLGRVERYQEMKFEKSTARNKNGDVVEGYEFRPPVTEAEMRGDTYLNLAKEHEEMLRTKVEDEIRKLWEDRKAFMEKMNSRMEAHIGLKPPPGSSKKDWRSWRNEMRSMRREKEAYLAEFDESVSKARSQPYSLEHHGYTVEKTNEGLEEALINTEQKPLVDSAWLSNLEKTTPGFKEYVEGFRKARDYELIRLIGDESKMLRKNADGTIEITTPSGVNEKFHFDDAKVARFADYMGSQNLKGGPLIGEEYLGSIANRGVGLAMTDSERIKAMKDLMTMEFNWEFASSYRPRNVMTPEKVPGVDVTEALKKWGLESVDFNLSVKHSRLMPRTNLVPMYSTDDLGLIGKAGGLTKEGYEHLDMVQRTAAKKYQNNIPKNEDPFLRTISLNPVLSNERAIRDSSALHAMVTAPSNVQWSIPKGINKETGVGVRFLTDDEVSLIESGGKRPDRDLHHRNTDSNWRGITLIHNLLPAVRQDILKDVIVPGMLGLHKEDTIAALSSMFKQKEWARKIAGSWLGKAIEEHGGDIGKEYIQQLKFFGDPNSPMRRVATVSERAASYLYVTHMGFNLASVALNMLQPLTNAATTATPGEVMGAYGKAFKSVFGYLSDRAKSGKAFATLAERDALIRKHFPYAESAGLTADFMAMLEGQHLNKKDTFLSRASHAAMSMFEKSEWFNKQVTSNLLEAAYKREGRIADIGSNLWNRDLEELQAVTQFGSNRLYRPMIFNRERVPGVHGSGMVSHPLFRQFMQFPLRTATTFLVKAPQWGAEENYWAGLARHAGRSLGYSAIVYEAGKHLLGADLSKGLTASAVTDITGGRKILHDDAWFPMPPIARLPASAIRGVMGDRTEGVQALSALIPGGIALSRALSMAPQLPMMGGGLLQKTYVDYSNVQQDGTVPIYKPDGSLVGYDKASNIVLKGLGVDLGSGQQQGQIDGYLIKQRQEIINYRQEFLRRMAGNDMSGAEAVRREFSAKYKDPNTGAPLPLTVTQSQVKQYLRSRDNIGRTERILDSLTPDVRMQMANAIGGAVTTGSDLTSGMTAGQRQRYNPAGRDQMVADIFSRVQSVGAAATGGSSPVGPASTSVDQGP